MLPDRMPHVGDAAIWTGASLPAPIHPALPLHPPFPAESIRASAHEMIERQHRHQPGGNSRPNAMAAASGQRSHGGEPILPMLLCTRGGATVNR